MTPEQEEQVRRTLAALARHDRSVPMPPDVAARLDRVLEDLTAGRGRAGAASPAGTAPEPTVLRPRRRVWPRVLVAAASMAVVVGAGTAVVRSGLGAGGGQGSASSASSAHDELPGGAGAQAARPGGGAVMEAVPRLRSATLHRDVQRVADLAATPAGGAHLLPRSAGRPSGLSPSAGTLPPSAGSPAGSAGSSAGRPVGPTLRSVLPSCVPPSPTGGGRLVAVRLDGRPATLVLPPTRGPAASGVARVYACRAPGAPVATTTVRAP